MFAYQAPPVLSVSVLARYLKELLQTDDLLQNVWVQGEISGCRTYASGHCYFTLKDAEAQLPCVFFKHARQRSGFSQAFFVGVMVGEQTRQVVCDNHRAGLVL